MFTLKRIFIRTKIIRIKPWRSVGKVQYVFSFVVITCFKTWQRTKLVQVTSVSWYILYNNMSLWYVSPGPLYGG